MPFRAPTKPPQCVSPPNGRRNKVVLTRNVGIVDSRKVDSELIPACEAGVVATNADVVETDPARDAYESFVKDAMKDTTFHSPALFCEMLLVRAREAFNALPDEPGLPLGSKCGTLRAAAACWALEILSAQPQNTVLKSIKGELFPCLFESYRQDAPQNLSIRTNSNGKTHTLSREKLEALTQMQTQWEAAIQQKMSSSRAIIRIWQRKLVGRVFVAWRSVVQRKKIERFAKEMNRKHGRREHRRALLESAFFQWRFAVECARSVNHQERIHGLLFQLDNAKNQFQLQCFRSDKYLRTVEELRENLARLREERDGYRKQCHEMEDRLRQHDDLARKELNQHINVLAHELVRWRQYARDKVEERLLSLQELDALQPPKSSNDESSSSIPAKKNVTDEEEMDLEGVPETKDDTAEPSSLRSAKEVDKENARPAISPEKALLCWCNVIVRQMCDIVQVAEVTNFTTSFQSGEVLLLLLHHVFPNDIPFTPLQESNNTKRAELICELARKVGVAHLFRPTDIVDGTGDVMLATTAELFSRSLLLRSSSSTPHGGEQQNTDTLEQLPVAEASYDVRMVPRILEEATKEFESLKAEEAQSLVRLEELKQVEEAVAQHAAYLVRERLKGHPIQVLDGKEVARFCKVNKARFADIAFKYAACPSERKAETWLPFDAQLDELKKTVKKYFHPIRRVFIYYAGSTSTTMSDADFWRFCSDIRLIDSTVTRHVVDRIFAVANSETVGEAAVEEASDEDPPPEEEDNPATELIPSEFVECLIRFADRKIASKMIHERFEAFFMLHVESFACKSEMDRFKKDCYEPSTQAAVQRYAKDLVKVFLHYSKGKGKQRSISVQDYTQLIRDGGIGTDWIDDSAVSSIFRNLLSEGELEELDQRSFLESIVAVSSFRVPTPFISLDKKIDVAVTALLSQLRAKLKGVVAISDVKPMPLQSLMRGRGEKTTP